MHEELTLQSAEDLPIRVLLDRPDSPKALVFVVHGFKGFKEWGFFPWIAEELAATGYAVCRFDMSRGGVGETPQELDRLDLFADDTYSIEVSDLCSVVESIGARPELSSLPTLLFGHSRGGGVALLAGHSMARLRAIVTWSAIGALDRWDDAIKREWREKGFMEFVNARTKQVMRASTNILDDLRDHADALDLDRALRELNVPLLVVHGTNDESVPSAEAHSIVSRAPNAKLLLIDGASHTYGAIHPLINVPKELREAMTATIAFYDEHVWRSKTPP